MCRRPFLDFPKIEGKRGHFETPVGVPLAAFVHWTIEHITKIRSATQPINNAYLVYHSGHSRCCPPVLLIPQSKR